MGREVERRSLVLRGVLDLCLLALLEEQVIYGYELTQRLGERGLPVADGSTYPLLARLERQGLVTTEHRPSTSGPARKYYAISEQGRRALAHGRAEWSNTATAVTALLAPHQMPVQPLPPPPQPQPHPVADTPHRQED